MLFQIIICLLSLKPKLHDNCELEHIKVIDECKRLQSIIKIIMHVTLYLK